MGEECGVDGGGDVDVVCLVEVLGKGVVCVYGFGVVDFGNDVVDEVCGGWVVVVCVDGYD